MDHISSSIDLKAPATIQTSTWEAEACQELGCHNGWQIRITPDHPQGLAVRCRCLRQKIEQAKYENLLRASNCYEYRHMRLDNYNPQNEPQRVALADISTGHGSFFIHGPWGTGKTHLMAGTVIRAIDEGLQAVLISVPELLREMRKTGRDDKSSIEDLAQDIPYLVLDDLGKQKDSDWTDERMFTLVDARYKAWQNGKSHTSITSNFTLDDLRKAGKIDGAVASRIEGMCKEIVLPGKDYRSLKA